MKITLRSSMTLLLRLWTLLNVSIVALMASDNPAWPTLYEWTGLSLFPLGVFAGMLIAFRRELTGGVITLVSLCLFYGWIYARDGQLPPGPWFILIATPGILFFLRGLCMLRKEAA